MYDIWRFSVDFVNTDGERDGTSFYHMFLSEKPKDFLRRFLDKEYPDETALTANFHLSHKATWCPGWFHHWTFDTGQSIWGSLSSFHDYIAHMREFNFTHGYYIDGRRHDKVCLMGAEDTWRWCGHDGTDPPCRCDDCKKLGRIRIDH